MADIITSNLYPPIIDTFMPAFTGDRCEVYFEISDFNTENDIDANLVQVSIRNQLSNQNCLENPNGIRYYHLEGPVTESGNPNKGKYYVTINENDLQESFCKNLYYKVQIRFTKANVATGTEYYNGSLDNPSITWINSHLTSFSEWSTVCLIRKITEPTLDENLQLNPFPLLNEYRAMSPFFHFSQTIKFGENEDEYLQSYRLKLFNQSNPEVPLEDSKIIYPPLDNRTNKVSYSFKTKLERGIFYLVQLDIVSNNLYQKTFTFNNVAIANTNNTWNDSPILTVIPIYEQGAFKIETTTNYSGAKFMAVYRSSSKDNFSYWDEIALVGFNNNESYVYIDRSIEAGTWYKYGIQLYGDTSLIFSGSTELAEPVSVLYEDVFLNSQGRQLKLSYDSHVTSYKRTVLENKVETLGSKFPIIRRNSATNYKQFALTGLITFHTDEEESILIHTYNHLDENSTNSSVTVGSKTFLTENELYGGNSGTDTITNLYHNYNAENGINPYNDYVKEREFREKVIDFLTSDKVFLLRTLTEGLILVRLMDINFTPKQELNNYIYTFTATAIEVAECNPENYYKYGVFNNLYSLSQIEG